MELVLKETMAKIAVSGKGILAADESTSTIASRFAPINLASTTENHRAYRELLFTTPNINQFLWGVILFEETLFQTTQSGQPFADYLLAQGILPGIKVDQGLTALTNSDDEKITLGLDTLEQRLTKYKAAGARFAKWRGVFSITDKTPSYLTMVSNAECLARYAAMCQAQGIVPIVEPEVLMDGDHTLERCAVVTENVLRVVFEALNRHKVQLETMILKPNMALPGTNCKNSASILEVAQATVTVLRRTVPAAVPNISFLSGGQSDVDATVHLKAMNNLGPHPWKLSFSYGRALQDACIKTWQGKPENVAEAQKVFYAIAEKNSAACFGK